MSEKNIFFDEMADDFFAECDELLSVIKRDLLRIDSMTDEAVPAEIIEELLRSCHTLKGLTGMVGAEQTMLLTHSIESFLKSVNKGVSSFTRESMDVLFRSIGLIESQLEGLRNKSDIPDSQSMLLETDALITKFESELHSRRIKKNDADLETGENVWKFLFTPSRELFDRGVNINNIRDRINSLGKVLSSNPKTDEEGRITFEFVVVTNQAESVFSEWVNDGLSYSPATMGGISGGEPVDNEIPAGKSLNLKNIVRVDLARLDDIMRAVGDLVISRSRLNDFLRNHGSSFNDAENLLEINTRLERQIREVREGIMKLRLVSTGEAFERMRFVIRDLVRENGKIIDLKIDRKEALIDKFIMDKIFDPLLHIVRNAVSHGIEKPEERISAGKPPEASLNLKATASGNSVIFEIADDGRGIDREQVIEKAEKLGFISHHQDISDEGLLNILCSPGFTTRENSDMISGRGVGMDVVKKSVAELGGHLDMQSEKGMGTRFTITLPLTLSIVEALIIKAGDSIYAIPMPSVEEVMKIDPGMIIRFEQNEIINYKDGILPIMRLSRSFNLNDAGDADHVIVISHGQEKVGILINRITGHREIVVRSITDPLVKVPGIYGATDLGDGRIVLILDTPAIINNEMNIRKEEKELV